jgi:hypothetical protein
VLGDRARWGELEHLMADVFDAVQVGNWQRARAHFKGKSKRPKPIRRPGDTSKTKRYGTGARPLPEVRKILDSWSTDTKG